MPESDALVWHFLSPETLQVGNAEALLSSDFRNTVVTSAIQLSLFIPELFVRSKGTRFSASSKHSLFKEIFA